MADHYTKIQVHFESSADSEAVYQVNQAAFGRPEEARLVDNLRGNPGTISLVAELDQQIVGHIFFCPVSLDEGSGVSICSLGPMAVLPVHQGRGIGSLLVQAGLQACQEAGYQLVVVLGHPSFYPRFGFQPARPLGILYPGTVPDEVFMVLELTPGSLRKCSGTIRYPAEFDDVS